MIPQLSAALQEALRGCSFGPAPGWCVPAPRPPLLWPQEWA
jgi:hypothetical protein